MKQYLLMSLLLLVTVANMHGEGSVGITGEIIETVTGVSEISATGMNGVTGASGTTGLDETYLRHFPLHGAVLENNVFEVKRLIASGADVNKKNDRQFVPLHLAIIYNFLDIAYILIDAHADVNIQTSCGGNTPLHLAVFLADKDATIEHLIDAGARDGILNKAGYTASDAEKLLQSGNEQLISSLKRQIFDDLNCMPLDKKNVSKGSIMHWLNDHPTFVGTVQVLFSIVAGIMLHNCLVLPEENNAPMPLIHRAPVYYPARAFMDSSNSDYIIIRNSVEW